MWTLFRSCNKMQGQYLCTPSELILETIIFHFRGWISKLPAICSMSAIISHCNCLKLRQQLFRICKQLVRSCQVLSWYVTELLSAINWFLSAIKWFLSAIVATLALFDLLLFDNWDNGHYTFLSTILTGALIYVIYHARIAIAETFSERFLFRPSKV